MARSHRTSDPRVDYIAVVVRVITRKLSTRRPWDVDDIAQAEASRLWPRIAVIMAAYPNPATFGAVRARHAAIQWDREQQVQAGEGARLVEKPDGTVAPARQVVSGDAVVNDDGVELFSRLGGTGVDLLEDGVVDSLERAALLERALVGLSAVDRAILYMVDGYKIPVSEVADMHGITRESMSRRISKLRIRTQANVAAIMTAGR